jgi:Family of unknown function (DUF5990)
MEYTIPLEIICRELPDPRWGGYAAIRLGIQKKTAIDQAVLLPQETAIFHGSLRVRQDPATGKPNFLGEFAHGTPKERFIYLCWEQLSNGQWVGFRRAKLPLGSVDWSLVESLNQSGLPLRGIVTVTDARQAPICASLKPTHLRWEG